MESVSNTVKKDNSEIVTTTYVKTVTRLVLNVLMTHQPTALIVTKDSSKMIIHVLNQNIVELVLSLTSNLENVQNVNFNSALNVPQLSNVQNV